MGVGMVRKASDEHFGGGVQFGILRRAIRTRILLVTCFSV